MSWYRYIFCVTSSGHFVLWRHTLTPMLCVIMTVSPSCHVVRTCCRWSQLLCNLFLKLVNVWFSWFSVTIETCDSIVPVVSVMSHLCVYLITLVEYFHYLIRHPFCILCFSCNLITQLCVVVICQFYRHNCLRSYIMISLTFDSINCYS